MAERDVAVGIVAIELTSHSQIAGDVPIESASQPDLIGAPVVVEDIVIGIERAAVDCHGPQIGAVIVGDVIACDDPIERVGAAESR